MTPADPRSGLALRWALHSAAGWLLGFVFVLLLALAWDALGGGAQFMVGVGMGAGVGLAQARVVRAWIERPWRWAAASTAGIGLPFLLWDLAALAALAGVDQLFSLPACVLVGGPLAGLLQRSLLRGRFAGSAWWIPACLAGWGLPAGIIALGDAGVLPGRWGVVPLAAMLFGGVLLGGVTGPALRRIVDRRCR